MRMSYLQNFSHLLNYYQNDAASMLMLANVRVSVSVCVRACLRVFIPARTSIPSRPILE